ncbi:MAG: phosphoribosylglycinamide formyltransferase [Candidatus Kerfeldbacteria bacterium]|nr:phosphoribosylglycinamide formyltransferase [Candidatus Kerfeldbacteria bacterium]
MAKALRLAVLGSTSGTDLAALLTAQQAGQLTPSAIVLVISNRAEAYILERARQANIETIVVPSARRSQADFEADLLNVLQQHHIDYIFLIGFMKILSAHFIAHFSMKILNIHPSLLPKYAGGMNLDVHQQVLNNRDAETGCTLHYVTADVDEGPIVGQERVPVLPHDTAITLKQRVQQAEQKLLLRAIHQLTNC